MRLRKDFISEFINMIKSCLITDDRLTKGLSQEIEWTYLDQYKLRESDLFDGICIGMMLELLPYIIIYT